MMVYVNVMQRKINRYRKEFNFIIQKNYLTNDFCIRIQNIYGFFVAQYIKWNNNFVIYSW